MNVNRNVEVRLGFEGKIGAVDNPIPIRVAIWARNSSGQEMKLAEASCDAPEFLNYLLAHVTLGSTDADLLESVKTLALLRDVESRKDTLADVHNRDISERKRQYEEMRDNLDKEKGDITEKLKSLLPNATQSSAVPAPESVSPEAEVPVSPA